MNKKQKENFKVRVGLIGMAFWNNGASGAKQFLKDWKLKELYELLEPEYPFLDEQKEIIVNAIEYASKQIYDEVWLIIHRLRTLLKCNSPESEIIGLLKMLVKIKKEIPAEEFKNICKQDDEWKQFFKELPQLKLRYGIK